MVGTDEIEDDDADMKADELDDEEVSENEEKTVEEWLVEKQKTQKHSLKNIVDAWMLKMLTGDE